MHRYMEDHKAAKNILSITIPALLIAVMTLFTSTGMAFAQENIAQEYYVPLIEEDLTDSFEVISSDNNGDVLTTVTIAIGGNTVIYYDQSENGYEADISTPADLYSVGGGGCGPANPAGTQIWGNSNRCDGIAPGFGTADADDVLTNGDVIVLQNMVPVNPRGSSILFDGGDKFAATYPVAVIRTGFPQVPGSLMAGAVEVFSSSQWGTSYQAPAGEDTDSDTGAWDYAVFYVMAGDDGTDVFLNGSLQDTLNEGENLVVHVNENDIVTANNPVQVDLITGDPGSSYEMRWDGLPPTSDWTNEYFMPVGDAVARSGSTLDDEVAVWFFNPNGTDIEISWEIGPTTTGSQIVSAGSAERGPFVGGPNGTQGGRFFTENGETFYALGQVDADDNGDIFDWGFPLIPAHLLSPQVLVGNGLGCTLPGTDIDDDQCDFGNTANARSFVWVMPVAGDNVQIFVDFDGGLPVCSAAKPSVDLTLELDALEIGQVMQASDLDATGARIWTCDGTKIAVAWGQDPSHSYSGDSQALDLGAVIIPLPTIQLEKSASFTSDNDGDGAISPGDTITYTLVIVNNGAFSAQVAVSDQLPAGVTYIADTTTYDDGNSITSIPDSGSTAFPLDEGGVSNLEVGPGEVHSIQYRITVNEAPNACTQTLINRAHIVATIGQTGETIEDDVTEVIVLTCSPGIEVVKFTNGQDANDPTGPVLPVGAPVTWDYTVTNIGDVDLVGVTLSDDIETIDVCNIPPVLAPGASFTCQATGTATEGQYRNVATVSGRTQTPPIQTVSDDDPSHYLGVLPVIEVTKTANPVSVLESGGRVTFTVLVTNRVSTTLTLTSITDLLLGDSTATSGAITNNTCLSAGPVTLQPGGSYTCTFRRIVSGDESQQHHNEVTATAEDEEGNQTSDDDDATVDITDALPVINVVKTPNPVSVPESGGNVTFSVVVKNLVAEVLTLTQISDALLQDSSAASGPITNNTCPAGLPATLQPAGQPGDTYTCSFQRFISGDESQNHHNRVTATATDDEGNPASDDDDATVDITDELPEIEVTKSANPNRVRGASGLVTFTVIVENVGPVPVRLISLMDTVFGDLNGKGTCGTGGMIPVGGSYTCSFSETITGSETLPHNNTVTAVVRDSDGDEDDDDDDETVPFDELPQIEVTKNANPTEISGSSGPVTFEVVVENVGPVSVTLTSLTDSVFGDLNGKGTCAIGGVIPVGGSYTCSFVETVSGTETLPHNDRVTAIARDKDGNEDTDDDDATVTFDELPEIEVTKTANPTQITGTSGVVTFTVVVENIGPVSVTLTSITDSIFGDLNGKGTCVTGGVIPVGGSYTCTFTETITSTEALPHNNIVTAVVQDKDGNDDDDDDDETVPTDEFPEIEVTKTANPTSINGTSGVVTFTVVVENVGPVSVTLTSLIDSVFGDLNGKGSCAIGAVIPVGGSYTCAFAETITGNKELPHNNTVTAVARDKDGHEDTDDDDETVPFIELPEVEVTKTANPGNVVGTTSLVGFTVEVINIGPVSVTLTSLTDSVFGDLNGKGTCVLGVVIPVGGTYTCAFSEVINGSEVLPHNNTITAVVRDKDGNEDDDDDDETVTFDELPQIEVLKSANPTQINGNSGQATFTIVVNNIGPVSVTLTSLTDTVFGDLNGKGNCTIGVVIPVGGSYTCSFVETITGSQTLPHHNTVTAVARDQDGHEDTDDDDETVTFVDALGTIGDRVWFDENRDGLQNPGEEGTAGVTVALYTSSDALVMTDTTDAIGEYLFTGLQPGGYYVEFTKPQGYNFTQYDANGNSQDAEDSDPPVPFVQVGVTDGNVEGQLNGIVTYTIFYTNTDGTRTTSDIVITTAVPVGTSYIVTGSTPGWSCTDANAGGICTITLPALNPDDSGSLAFVVKLKDSDPEVPNQLDLSVSLTQDAVGRSQTITLGQGEVNRTLDAGLVRTVASEQTPTSTATTNLPETEQPTQRESIFLPTVQAQ